MASNAKTLTALVTGGASGLGGAICDEFRDSGITVIATTRKTSIDLPLRLNEKPVYLDVCDPISIHNLFKWIETHLGHIDILVNNAGIGLFKPFSEITLEAWDDVIRTNLTGAFLCSQKAVELMPNTGGRILHIGSIAGAIPLADNAPYGISKAALRFMSALINEEFHPRNINSTLITLGAVGTDIWKDRKDFITKDMLSPKDVAQTIREIAIKKPGIRVDEITLLPPKGILNPI